MIVCTEYAEPLENFLKLISAFRKAAPWTASPQDGLLYINQQREVELIRNDKHGVIYTDALKMKQEYKSRQVCMISLIR